MRQTTYEDAGVSRELALTPSRIYTKAVVEMFGGYQNEPQAKVHGVAHITGGGVPEKLGRVLKPSGLGAGICNAFVPPDLMKYCQEKGNVSDKEAYKTWNMWQGMIIITPEPDKVVKVAGKHNIKSKLIGIVQKEKGIKIKSEGIFNCEEYLNF